MHICNVRRNKTVVSVKVPCRHPIIFSAELLVPEFNEDSSIMCNSDVIICVN